MLILAGHGLSRESATDELKRAIEEADIIYFELYTMPASSWLAEVARELGERAILASRQTLEEESRRIVELAKHKRVVIVTAGDPLIATSHQALVAEARAAGVEVRYVPGVSGVTAAKAMSGLQYYRFGRTFTVPSRGKVARPYSVVGFLYGNLCVDLHSLLLLDVSDSGQQLQPSEAARIVLETEEELERILSYAGDLARRPALVVERAGTPEGAIKAFDSLEDLAEGGETFREPSSLVVPAPLNRVEEWILSSLLGRRLGAVWSIRLREDYCERYKQIMSWMTSTP